jgi:hypothetical protein
LKYKKKQNYTMNKKEFNYVSPTATVKEMQAEGVLCISANLFIRENGATFQDWEEDNTFQW